jgi:hypothetical protein
LYALSTGLVTANATAASTVAFHVRKSFDELSCPQAPAASPAGDAGPRRVRAT